MIDTAIPNPTQTQTRTQYPAYKDSGVEWLGEIPTHWDVKPGFTITSERKEKNVGLKEKIVLSLSYGRVIVKTEDKLTGLVPESFETYQLVYPGDIIIRPTDLQNDKTSLRTGFSTNKGIITSAYLNFQIKRGGYSKYFYYFFHLLDINKTIYGLGSGLRQNLDFSDFKRFPFVIPPLAEQTRIAEFLDRKTAQIDQAIAQKERLIELLNERRQVMIHKAVTRGLDPNVPMKNSGIDWVSEIPAHWEVRHLRRLFSFLNTRRIPISAPDREKRQGEYPYYGASGIIDYVDDFIFNEPLILIAEDGANLLSKSTPLAFVATGKYWVNNHAHIIKPVYGGLMFWSELLCEFDYTPFISGAAQPKLTKDNLASIVLPVPPQEEINQIEGFIKNLDEQILPLKKQFISTIKKLQELKSTLINSAVTGKIKV